MAIAAHQKEIPKTPPAPRRNTHRSPSNAGRAEIRRIDGESLAEVVAACQQGNHEARRQLYDSCHQNIFRLSTRMVGLQDAADVTQQVFLKAFRSIGQFNRWSRFETWLYRLGVNESLQHLRRKKRWRYQTLDWEPTDESDHAQELERKDLLEQSLARINRELRSIFLLRELEGLSYRDIAETLQIPQGTVGSRLNRARRELQKHLAELGFEW